MINWTELFSDHGINYVTSGRNTSRGWISVKCPICGPSDESEHMGINLAHGYWTCWRDATHKGKNPERLLMLLLGGSKAAASLLIEAYTTHNLDDYIDPLKTSPGATIRPKQLPPEFKPIERGTLTHNFWQYLYGRGFDDPDQLISDYNLKACLRGRWNGRLIIPIYDEKGLVGWQGRSLKNHTLAPRYLTSSNLIKKTIFNLQNLNIGNALYICEGPIDALKIDYIGKSRGIRATCLFGVNFTYDQVSILIKLQNRFEKVKIIPDTDSAGIAAAFQLADYLPVEIESVPDDLHDPGSMTKQQLERWLR